MNGTNPAHAMTTPAGQAIPEVRLRSRIDPGEMAAKVGKILAPTDVSMMLIGPARVYKPNGDLLCVYIPGAVPAGSKLNTDSHAVLTTIRGETDNRGLASGSKRVAVKQQTRAKPVMSSILGSIEPQGGRHRLCRTTAWTGEHTRQFGMLYGLFQHIGKLFQLYVPDRYEAQQRFADRSAPDWIIPKTPYSTITVNNTYPTGVHKDAGDLHEGFSCLLVLRRGQYSGGQLCFPEFRLGVDMQDGDLLLMDAHEWHGNIALNLPAAADAGAAEAERISVVLYYRTAIVECGTQAEELERAKRKAGALLSDGLPAGSGPVRTSKAQRHANYGEGPYTEGG